MDPPWRRQGYWVHTPLSPRSVTSARSVVPWANDTAQ